MDEDQSKLQPIPGTHQREVTCGDRGRFKSQAAVKAGPQSLGWVHRTAEGKIGTGLKVCAGVVAAIFGIEQREKSAP